MSNRRHKGSSGEEGAAFVMGDRDRFHMILVADGVTFEAAPGYETVLTFFVIRRAAGTFTIVNIVKTFQGDKCASRKVQTKDGIAAGAIQREMDALTGAFTLAIEAGSGKNLVWHTLDLSGVTDMGEQAQRISAWGRVRAWVDEMPAGFTKPSVN